MKKKNSKTAAMNRAAGRGPRRRALSVVITVLVVAAVILLNIAVQKMTARYSLYLDTTENKAYRLQEVTAAYAASIEKDVDFYVLADETTFEDYGDYYVQANKLIHQLAESAEHISLHYVDLTADPTFAAQYPVIDWTAGHLCLVACGDNYRVIDADDMFDYEFDSSTYTYVVTDQHIEQALASALLSVTAEKISTVAVMSGQAEKDMSAFIAKLSGNAYNVVTVDLSTEPIPDEAEFLVINAPDVDIDDDMLTYISDWLVNSGSYGRNLVYIPTDQKDVAEFPNLNALIADYGMSIGYGYIYEEDATRMASRYNDPRCSSFDYADERFVEMLRNRDIPVYLCNTLPVFIEDSGAAKAMLTSSERSVFVPMIQPEDTRTTYQSYTGAAIGEKNNGSTEDKKSSNVVVIGSYDAFSDEFLNYNAYNNTAYFINVFNSLSSVENIGVIIEGKDLSNTALGVDSAASVTALTVIARYIIPAAVLIAGLIIWLIRRHR